MRKRFLSLILISALVLGLTLPCAQAGALGAYVTRYVYTQNGLSLNVRESPSTGAKVIGGLPYGTAVEVRGYTGGSVWAIISYYGATAYVQSRYLVDYYPAPYSDAQKILDEMNAEFRSAKTGNTPFTVAARPSRSSGWVNLRWAPSLDAEVISKCYSGKVLTVIRELKNWYQVEDPETGSIGFISRQYVTIIGAGTAR